MSCYSGTNKESPTLNEISNIVMTATEWNSIELSKTDDNDSFESQLIIFVEPNEGVLLRFCGKSGDDEFVFTGSQNHGNESDVETFDGGDVWIVPSYYFNKWDDALPIVKGFLQDGTMHQSNNWVVLGEME